ncbi:ATP-binding protein [Cellulophaga baltica]|uniref:ATP-dependent nuclease n=1 Tax=Cellulophaga baltica TaxID=76594 RepID=UPI0021490B59|nr:ATP-binding protein [Cellulophaga baltica]MCR1026092.1 ATP-binding protein [Cellulophaga baltica]
MIKDIKIQFGSHPNGEKLLIETSPVTVFVGPNNSGKSKLLTEIQQFSQRGAKDHSFKLIDDINFNKLDNQNITTEIVNHTLVPNANERVSQGRIVFGSGRTRKIIDKQLPNQFLSNPNRFKSNFCSYYLLYKTLKLDALNRISLINQQPIGDLQSSPSNNLSILFKDDDKRMEVRRIIEDAFGLYFVLDPTNAGHLRIRLSKTSPENHQIERGLHKEAVDFHKQAMEITRASDGVKAFTGIITSIIAGNPKVTILDEPEAFLHPSLSFKLGKEIASSAKIDLNKLFVSTHSSNFLMGCIQSGAPINIVRLTYSNEIGTARLLEKEKIATLMQDPLLRSTGVLNALFYKHVIVTEGDSDRAFYQEINERLLEFSPERGISNCLFLNAVGKDTIWKIVKPLREMGIPAIGIYDIDILKNEGSNWTNALKSSFVPEISHQPFGQTRSLIKKKFSELELDMKKDGGINALPDSEKEASENLFNQLEEYGIFTVRTGEVEHWLQNLEVNVHKSVWLPKMFEKMGSDPSDLSFVKPSSGDVWDFIGSINNWMSNENRKGIPK